MKKLLFILSAVFVSVSMMAAVNPDTDWNHPNPFAYDLKSEVIDNGATLKLTYSLNATAVTDKGYNNQSGLQIYLIDENGNRVKDANGDTWKCTSGAFTKGTHSVNISVADLPPAAKDKLVSWEVVVHGNKERTQPQVVYTNIKTDNSVFYPRAAHGIAVGKNPDKPNFAKLFTAEASTNTLSGKSVPNSLWEYNMQMKYQKYHHKDILDGGTSHFSATTNTEPHRVKISDDGRIFATCYHETAISAVLEYVGNGNWKTVVIADVERNSYQDEVLYSKADKYNRRPIAMDVEGSGDNLKIIVAWMKPKGKKINNNGKNDRMHAQIQVIEYEVGSNNYNIDQDNGTVVAEYIDHDTEGNRGGTYDGMLFQSYYHGYNQAQHGFIGVAYGDDNSIWLKVDFGFGISDGRRSHILRYDQGSTEAKYTYTFPSADKYRSSGGYYGGAGLLIKGNQLITGSGSNSLLIYTIESDKTLDETDSNVKSYASGTPGTSTWLDAITEDYAGNLYCISEAADNIVIFAMPYDGTRITRASAEQSFTVSDPIPNILATDLRFAPDGNSDRYVFSFNVNTTPQVAQIRFYKSYGDNGENDMKKNLAKINADDYQGEDAITPSFVYDIPADQLKQGKISVSLGMCGGTIEGGKITNGKLPRGEWYWSVYVEAPRKSSVFAPIYKQGTTGEDEHYRLHATVNNYPETDQFGHLYAVNYHTGGDTRNGLMVYGFNPNGKSNDEQNNILNSYRYKLVKNYLNPTGSKPKFTNQRRLAVAPDGKVYIADCGSSLTFKSNAERPWMFQGGGVFVWNPNTQTGDEIQVSQFLFDKTETSTAVTIYNHSGQMKLYATNTYGEFANHTSNHWNNHEYTEANQANTSIYGWNGFKEYNLGTIDNILLQETASTTQQYSLGMGDGNGNTNIVAMDKGVWMAQHREGDVKYSEDNSQALPDNPENYVLSFIPYGNTSSSNKWGGRTWRSCTTTGTESNAGNKSANSQTEDAPLQSCPGAGLAYRKVNNKEYLYIVQHSGDIAQFEIRSWNGTTPSVYHVRTYPSVGNKTVIGHGTNTVTTRPTGTITSMCFDYAGNLITTAGQTYFKDGMSSQDIVVYTMPYDRVNAREIQAPNSCRMIPERMAQTEDNATINTTITANTQQCALDFFRPLQSGMYNTICLPFDLNVNNLPDGHPYKGATIMEFNGVTIANPDGEEVLELNFTSTNGQITAGTPYLIQPEYDVPGVVSFDVVTFRQGVTAESVSESDVTFAGVLGKQALEEGQLLVVANNRLAESTGGTMLGFRAYFILSDVVRNMQPALSFKRPVATAVGNASAEGIDVEKFIREGRIYIRLDDQVYDLTGARVQ